MAQALTLARPLDGLWRIAAQVRLRARSLWRAYPRETLGAGVLGLVAAAAVATSVVSNPVAAERAEAAAPAPPPLILQQITPDQALKVNAEIPVASGPNPAAAAFVFKGGKDARAQALECLASAVYYEAGNQDTDGERAVAQVVLNRVRHPAFPNSVCGVVYQGSTRVTGCQFTFTCDGSLTRRPDADGWRRAYQVAEAALSGYVYAPVGWATHYHADYVVPTWASSMAKNAVVGAHIFYRWAGTWGQPAIFAQHYAGIEPSAAALRTAALSVVHTAPAQGQGSAVAEAIHDIPGAEPLKLAPSMRGDKLVAIRFNLAARKASDQAPHEDYTRKFDASDNLKWALSGDGVGENEKPLGKGPAGPSAATVGSTAAVAGAPAQP
jgi:spore germination cell wall hydrolase CwlJ-like protein